MQLNCTLLSCAVPSLALRILASSIALHIISDETVVLLGHHTKAIGVDFNKHISPLRSIRHIRHLFSVHYVSCNFHWQINNLTTFGNIYLRASFQIRRCCVSYYVRLFVWWCTLEAPSAVRVARCHRYRCNYSHIIKIVNGTTRCR